MSCLAPLFNVGSPGKFKDTQDIFPVLESEHHKIGLFSLFRSNRKEAPSKASRNIYQK